VSPDISELFDLFAEIFSAEPSRLLRTSPKKSGRPLSAHTIAIREAITALQLEQERMTTRGVYYALSTRGIVEKTDLGYRQVQRQTVEMRRKGILPWSFIRDGSRWAVAPETFDSTDDALRETARTYRRNLWRSQGVRIEVWLEKDALQGIVSDVTYEWGVRLMVSRGQSSETFCYDAAREAWEAWDRAGVETVVYALYDSDRSGRNAATKIEQKLRRYSNDAPITFELLAVTDDQIEEWDLPTRPAKENKHEIAVELDAIPPDKLIGLVESAIIGHVDADAWSKERVVEKSERDLLLRMAGLR
jgi:hypothetical protein